MANFESSALTCLLAGVTAGVAGCIAVEGSEDSSERVILDGDEVTFATRRMMYTGVEISGTLEARVHAELAAKMVGVVREIHAEVGDRVTQGQTLARLGSKQLEYALRTARARLMSAEKALRLAQDRVRLRQRLPGAGELAAQERAVDLSARSLAQAQVEQARAELASARNALADAIVQSPIDGVISARSVQEHEFVRPGSPMFVVLDPSSLHLRATARSGTLSELHPGMSVRFRLRTRPGELFHGSIRSVAPVVGPAGRIAITVSLQRGLERLPSGSFAEGRVTTNTQYILALPRAAVDWSGARPQVALIRDGRIARVDVELGIVDEMLGLVGIRAGVNVGEQVALGSARYLAAGTRVRTVGSKHDVAPLVLESEKLAGSASSPKPLRRASQP